MHSNQMHIVYFIYAVLNTYLGSYTTLNQY